MKTRYFVSDSYKLDDNVVGRELYLKHGAYYFKDGIVSNCVTFCGENQEYEIHITKVEEMELSDFIADGRTKYELNGIRFVVGEVVVDGSDLYIDVICDTDCSITKLCGKSELFIGDYFKSGKEWSIVSRSYNYAKHYHSHIEDIKLVTTCGQCGKVEVQDLGLCSDCISKLPKIESSKVVDIHQNANGSFSVGSVVNMCENDEIVYTRSQYVEAIEKEVPELSDVRNKYDVQIVGKDGVKTTVDVYRVLNAFEVHDAATQHAIKKLLAAGKRGHKDYVQDLKEGIASVELAIYEWEQTNV